MFNTLPWPLHLPFTQKPTNFKIFFFVLNYFRQQIERHFLTEVERIQSEIDSAVHIAESSNNTTDSLKHEVAIIENAIAEKKKQVEQLVNEMKEVNLQSLAVAPSEEVRNLLEGKKNLIDFFCLWESLIGLLLLYRVLSSWKYS